MNSTVSSGGNGSNIGPHWTPKKMSLSNMNSSLNSEIHQKLFSNWSPYGDGGKAEPMKYVCFLSFNNSTTTGSCTAATVTQDWKQCSQDKVNAVPQERAHPQSAGGPKPWNSGGKGHEVVENTLQRGKTNTSNKSLWLGLPPMQISKVAKMQPLRALFENNKK